MGTILGRTSVQIQRQSGAYDAGGIWQPDLPAPFNIRAGVQPLTGLELQRLPTGQRQVARYKVYTNTALQTVELNPGQRPDLLTYKGQTLEVVSVEDWQDHQASTKHYKFLLVLQGADQQ
ncbi:MAG: hypothetical protein KAI73_02080 [Rhodospirillaceae bacterium]|nr:hypothetical protein [Rhodospirillaceae bacterium]